MTGVTDEREGLKRCLAGLNKPTSSFVLKIHSLVRIKAEVIHIVDTCYKKRSAIRFLENGLSTEGTMGKMIIQILAAVAEAERKRFLKRTNDGRGAAMASGFRFGRKPHPTTASALIPQRVSFKVVSEKTDISRPTYSRLKRRFTAKNKRLSSAM